jgi:sodium pump decarboxylase gamma subunit
MDTPLINGLFVFILGLLVVFTGMLIIVLAVQLLGKIMNKSKEKVKDVKAETLPQPVATSEEIPDHIKAAIVAVISAYYFESKSSCDFVVKKIKRI